MPTPSNKIYSWLRNTMQKNGDKIYLSCICCHSFTASTCIINDNEQTNSLCYLHMMKTVYLWNANKWPTSVFAKLKCNTFAIKWYRHFSLRRWSSCNVL